MLKLEYSWWIIVLVTEIFGGFGDMWLRLDILENVLNYGGNL